MSLKLTIDNVSALANGGPTSFAASARGFSIGRENNDWNLPDNDFFISGRHCDIRFEHDAFWLYDVSRNGTFVNGATERISAPYRLKQGDKLQIGRYLISVSVEPAASSPKEFKSGAGGEQMDVLRGIATAAGMSPEAFAARESGEAAAEIGAVLNLIVEELAVLLKARAAAKVLAKTSHRTMIGSTDNNPLKFVPATTDILETMFSRKRSGYMDARASFKDAFGDLKAHELATYAAMQTALSRLLEDLSPDAIELRVPASSFASKKSRAWELFSATWRAREDAHENGMLDVFLAHFGEAYAKAVKPK